MQGVVVEEHKLVGLGCLSEGDRVRDARMAEAAPGRVLILGVLRIVDQSVNPVGERVAARPTGNCLAGSEAQIRLVVGDEGKRAAVVGDTQPDGRATVDYGDRPDRRRADLELILREVVEVDSSRHLVERDREERW